MNNSSFSPKNINHISDVIPHMTDGIKLIERESYSVIDYTYAASETFVNEMAIECRGLKFDLSGALIARPLHKFFNVGEKQQADEIDWSKPHRVYEKLDGSMVHGCILDEKLVFMTRGGISPQAKMAFCRAGDSAKKLAKELARDGFTAIFEFTSPDNRIVIPYAEDRLTLLAARKISTGEYLSHDSIQKISDEFGVPIARSFDPVIDHTKFISDARNLTGVEGYIIAFDCGHRLKIKCDEYVFRHKALATISSEKNVLMLVLDDCEDDAIASLAPPLAERLTKFARHVREEISFICRNVRAFVEHNKSLSRKDFAATANAELPKPMVPMVFACLDGKDINVFVRDALKRSTKKKEKLAQVKEIFPVYWNIDDIPVHELT